MTPVLALTTVGNSEDAREIARQLVKRHLAACVNIVPSIHSIYWWEEKVSEDAEHLLLIKTTRERLSELRDLLLSIHPYDVPEFVVVAIDDIAPSYRDWLVAATSM